ncbi:hypothetical protein [Actinoallomurus vinaceus]|uniref:hypothetical protein n=1 Tax=Actinoallomurus vinaceus TaxID=1080074 RepID=UPI0031E9909A
MITLSMPTLKVVTSHAPVDERDEDPERRDGQTHQPQHPAGPETAGERAGGQGAEQDADAAQREEQADGAARQAEADELDGQHGLAELDREVGAGPREGDGPQHRVAGHEADALANLLPQRRGARVAGSRLGPPDAQ